MKRALLFAPYFLPRRRVGSMRPFRFVLHLRAFGWEPTVLTIATPGQHLTDKEARLLDGIEVVEVAPPFDRSARAESQLGSAHRTPPRRRGPLDGLLQAFDRQFPVDTWLLLFLLKYPQLVATLRRVRPHVLWATGDPWSALVVGGLLKRHLGVPYVADFRDPWTLCAVRPRGQSALTRAADRFFERHVLEAADAVLFQSTQNERQYRTHYREMGLQTTTIFNSYDPDVFDDPVAVDRAVPPTEADGLLHVGFFGRFRAWSPATPVIDVLAELRAARPEVAGRIRVHAFGPLNEADAARAAARGVDDLFVAEEAVPLERALAALRRFDLLLVSTHPQRDEIIPAKLLEYLAAGRPVLSLSKNPEVARLLETTGTGVQVAPEAREPLADLLAAGVEARRSGRPLPVPFAPRPEAIRRFDARYTTGELAELFDRVAAGYRPDGSRPS